MPNKPPDEGDAFTRLQQRVADQQYDIDASRRARELYIPKIEASVEKVSQIEAGIARLAVAGEKVAIRVEELADRIGPVLTERAVVLKAIKWWGGILLGIGLTLTEEYLRRRFLGP